MRRYLLVALWPVGIAAITAATVIAARRAPASPVLAAVDDPASPENGPEPAGGAGVAAPPAAGLADAAVAGEPGPGRPASAPGSAPAALRSRPGPATPSWPATARPDWMPDLIRLGAISCAGGILS